MRERLDWVSSRQSTSDGLTGLIRRNAATRPSALLQSLKKIVQIFQPGIHKIIRLHPQVCEL